MEDSPAGLLPATLDRLLKEGGPQSLAIHVVDDRSENLLDVFEFLTKLGFHVTASTTGKEAMELVRRGHPKVLITSVQLPDREGLELLEEVKHLSPETRVILTADQADWKAYREVLIRGGDDLLVNPVTHEMLLRAVGRVLEAED
jgi:DNA-binding NtrC family response regulator